MSMFRLLRIFLLILLLFPASGNAQPCFEKSYGGHLDERAVSIISCSRGGYLVLGNNRDTVFNTSAYYLLKIDEKGNEEWSRSYGDQYNAYASAITETPDGGFAFIGTHEGRVYNAVAEVVILDSIGQKINSRTFPPLDGWGTSGIGIISAPDTSLSISIYTDGFISQNFYSMLNVGPAFNIRWSAFISYDGSLVSSHSVARNSAGRYWSLGYYPDYFYSVPNVLMASAIRRLSSTGQVLKDSIYAFGSEIRALCSISDNGIALAGVTDSLPDRNISLTRIDSTGNVVFQHFYNNARDEEAIMLKETNDSGIAILTSKEHTQFPGLHDIQLIKTSLSGDSLWSTVFGAAFDEQPLNFALTPDNGFILLGHTNSFGDQQIYVVKTDSMGRISTPYSITGNGHYFCSGDSVQLQIQPIPPPGFSIRWSSGDTTGQITVYSAGNYSAIVSDTLQNEYSTQNYFTFFGLLPDADISDKDTSGICIGTKLINRSQIGPSMSFKWLLNDTVIPGITQPEIQPMVPGKYQLVISNYCSSDTATVFIDTIYSLPAKPVLNITGNTYMCPGDTLDLYCPGESYLYQWWRQNVGPAQQIAGATDSILSITSPDTYFVQRIDSNGCSSDSNPLNVLLDNFPAYVNSTGPLSFCLGGYVLLSTPQGSNIQWSTGDTTFSIFVNSDGNYSFSMNSVYGCPKLSDTARVTVYPPPHVTIGGDTVLCRTSSLLLDPGPDFVSYFWQDGSSSQTFLAFSPGGVFDTVGYSVIVIDSNGCQNKASMQVTFDICQEISEGSEGDWKAYPNPVASGMSFRIEPGDLQIEGVELINSLGKRIRNYSSVKENYVLGTEGLNHGIYFLRILVKDHPDSFQKLIIE